MKKDDCKFLGTLSKPHGYKGHMVLAADNSLPDDFEEWESVFVEIDGLLVPFLFDDINHLHDNSAVVRFQDYENIDLIGELIHSRVYAPVKNFRKKKGRSYDIFDLEGYLVIDIKLGEIGKIEEVLDYNMNIVFRILKEGKEILIPAQEPIIESIDSRKKTIHISAPDGLISMYLDE